MELFNDYLWNLIAILAVIVGFGFLIFVHELGHFVVAKWVGIRCTQFAIGFGQSMLTYRPGLGFRVGATEAEYQQRLKDGASESDIGETEYRLNWIPLGGYVKMLGQEDIGPDTESSDPRAYNNKPVWARACVISAGVIMNLIFGLLFLIIAFMAGVQFPSAVVGQVDPSMPAAVTYATGHEGEPAYRGLRPGDRITHVNGGEVRDFMDVQMATMLGHPETLIRYTVDRPGYDRALNYEMRPRAEGPDGLLTVGIGATASLRVGEVPKHAPAYAAGVREEMRIVAVDGQGVETYVQYLDLLAAAEGRPVAVTFRGREGEEVTIEQAARPVLERRERAMHLAGLVPVTEIVAVPTDRGETPASRAGVQPGDAIAELAGEAWPSPQRIFALIDDEPVHLVVERDGRRIDLGHITPDRHGRIGIVPEGYRDRTIVSGTLGESPAAGLELAPGTQIVSVDGEAVQTWGDMQRVLSRLAREDAQRVSIAYRLPDAQQPETGELVLDDDARYGLITTRWTHPPTVGLYTLQQRVSGANPIAATAIGIEKTHQFMVRIYQTVLRLVQGTVRVEHLRGPVGIVHEGTHILDRGWTYFLFFLGLISVNLAVINFLPIPIVDGGHMVFLIIEKLKGSPASPQIQGAATMVGLALLLLLFVSITYHDIARLLPW